MGMEYTGNHSHPLPVQLSSAFTYMYIVGCCTAPLKKGIGSVMMVHIQKIMSECALQIGLYLWSYKRNGPNNPSCTGITPYSNSHIM
jgi:hypothetical protein